MGPAITRKDWRWAALLVVVALVCYLPGAAWGLPACNAVVGAVRILDGDLLYRDFWTMYAPGQWYAIAAVFSVFGRELWVQALLDALVKALAAGAFFLLLRRQRAPLGISLLLTLVFVGAFWKTAPEFSTYPPALLCIFASLHYVARYLSGATSRGLFRAGLLLGVAACFKHDVAFYVAFAVAVTFCLTWLVTGDRPGAWRNPPKATARVAAGALLVAVPVIVALAATSGPRAFEYLIEFPATRFAQVFGEPYADVHPPLSAWRAWAADPFSLWTVYTAVTGSSTWLLCLLPELVFPAAVLVLAWRWRRLEHDRRCLAVLWLAPMPLFWWAAHTQQNTHIYSMAWFSFLLIGLALAPSAATGESLPAPRGRRALRAALPAFAALYALALFVPPARSLALAVREWPQRVYLDLPGARGIWVGPRQAAYRPIIRFLNENLDQDEPIYVGVMRHDAVVIGDQRFYWLARRPIATHYNEIHAGFVDNRDIQRAMIARFEKQKLRCAVLWKFGWPGDVLDEIKARRVRHFAELGSTLLDDYFRREFEPLEQHGEYVVMWRRGIPPPRAPAAGDLPRR